MRNIFTVEAKQIVTSENNPQGLLSNVANFPKTFDSRDYNASADNPNGDESVALSAARSEFHSEVVALSTAKNANRVGWAVYIVRGSDGKQLDHYSQGGFPDMTPQHEPEPEEQGEQ